MSDSQTIQVAHKLIPNDQEGSNQWMTKEIDLIRETKERARDSHHVLVCSDLPGTEQSKDYYLEKIRNFLTDCKQDKGKRNILLMKYNFIINYLVIIWYTGHGEKNTGNWCFKDGVITFQDIFGLYMDCFKGKLLNIHFDCSYSGNWIKNCAKTLDGLGIPSCGHHTREQEILLRVFCSCGANEKATALCYITEGNEFDETNKYVLTYPYKKLSSGQTTKLGEFTDIRCSKTATKICEIDSTCTWEDRILSDRICILRGKNRGRNVWYFFLVDEDKLDAYNALFSDGNRPNIEFDKYGKVLYSGWGENPPEAVQRNFEMRFYSFIDSDQ